MNIGQVIAFYLFNTEPSPKSTMNYRHLNPWEQTLFKLESKYKSSIPENISKNNICENGGHFM